ncbi:MAG: hypothetical protein GEU83_21000 [Pseudonocardiaceae bacterium]|nr:hypothetical protein [Pseudonocardiaceae bacterium]
MIVGLILGMFLGLVLAAAAWATGRRPYLRVDVQRHTTREVVHHVVDHTGLPGAAAPRVVDPAVVVEALPAMPTVRRHPAVYRDAVAAPVRKEIGR